MSVQDDTPIDQPPVEAPADTSQDDAPIQALPTDQPQDEPQQTEAQQAERDEKGRFKGLQPRIDELTRKRHEAEREAAYWKGVATQGKAPNSADAQQAAPAAPEKPTPAKFDDYGAYIEALTEWKADQKITQALTQREAEAAQRQQAQQQASTWETRQAAARAAVPDYDQVVGASDAPVAKHVADALVESEHGPALAYHFAKHPEALERLNDMSARQADREIGRLEERLAASAAQPAAATPAKTSNAPKPASATAAQGRSTTPPVSQMSMEQYMQHRKQQGARWAR